MPKKTRRLKKRSYKRRPKTTKRRQYRKNIKNKSALARGYEKINCCICDKEISREDSLVPAVCLSKNGDIRGHRICKECWFNSFAKEGVNHECPGCVKNLPLNGQPIDKTVVIDLTEY